MDAKKLKAELANAFRDPSDEEIERLVARDVDLAFRVSDGRAFHTETFAAILRHIAMVRGETRRGRAFEAIANALPSLLPEPRPPRGEADFDIPPGIEPS